MRRLAMTLGILGLAFGLAVSALAAPQAKGLNDVPQPLLNKLNRGVNVTRWFCYLERPSDTKHFETYFGDDDIAALKRLKVSFVRLCLSPEAIYDNGKPNETTLRYVDRALDRLQRAGMAVLFDLHDNGQLKLDGEGKDNSGLVTFWEGVAKHYRGRRLNDVVFEIVNEPTFQTNPATWYDLQAKTVKAIRAIDPKRTIMVTPTSWSGIDALIKMEPLPEKNLIYTYHCYDPFPFTHQGASWAGDAPKGLKNVPFPASPEAVAPILPDLPEVSRGWAKDYGDSRFDIAALRKRIETASLWARAKGLPIVLGEFGSYPLVAPADSRARWFGAIRTAIDEYRMPSAIWGYDDALGLGRRREADGKLWLDPVTLGSFYGVRD